VKIDDRIAASHVLAALPDVTGELLQRGLTERAIGKTARPRLSRRGAHSSAANTPRDATRRRRGFALATAAPSSP